MDALNTTVKPACTFGRCGKPATQRISIAYPARNGAPAYTWPPSYHPNGDDGSRCDQHTEEEIKIAAYVSAVVTTEPLAVTA